MKGKYFATAVFGSLLLHSCAALLLMLFASIPSSRYAKSEIAAIEDLLKTEASGCTPDVDSNFELGRMGLIGMPHPDRRAEKKSTLNMEAPGAHEGGLEYGDNAPEIAAQNMALHIAHALDGH